MDSFYGGHPGISFIIVEHYDSVRQMLEAFAKGGAYEKVKYGQYVIIDTVMNLNDKRSLENGLIFCRGFNYQEPFATVPDINSFDRGAEGIDKAAYELAMRKYFSKPGAGAIYIGQIAGPQGETPYLEFMSESEVKILDDKYKGTGEIDIVSGKEQDKITYSYCNIKDKYGNYAGCALGFTFPYHVMEISGESLSPYDDRGKYDPVQKVWSYSDLIEKESGNDQIKPFYSTWRLLVPKGIHGADLFTIGIDEETQEYYYQVKDYNAKEEGDIEERRMGFFHKVLEKVEFDRDNVEFVFTYTTGDVDRVGAEFLNDLVEEAGQSAADAAASAQAASDSEVAAQEAQEKAEAAADSATEQAAAALESANNAKTSEDAAEKAKVGAETAQSKAEAAKSAAETAKSGAEAAKAGADAAKTEAAASATQAEQWKKLAESYAHGGTGERDNEDTDNSKYYYQQILEIIESLGGTLIPKGTITFTELKRLGDEGKTPGFMYNISDEFTSDNTFKDGGNHHYGAGNNVYYTVDNLWDVLAGPVVTGVKGSAESVYRQGNVEITKANIGLSNVDNTADSVKNVASAKKLTTARAINGISFNGENDISIGNLHEIKVTNTDFRTFVTTLSNVHHGSGSSEEINVYRFGPIENYTNYHLPCLDSHIFVMSIDGNTNHVRAIAFDIRTKDCYVCCKNNSSWTEWYKLLDSSYSIPLATTTANGLMSAADKTKLDTIGAVITITKSLAVTTAWMDTGITSANLTASGPYLVQMTLNAGTTGIYSSRWTGIMGWLAEDTNSGDTDEILLHCTTHANNGNRLFLRTLSHARSSNIKATLQIAATTAFAAAQSITFTFRKLI